MAKKSTSSSSSVVTVKPTNIFHKSVTINYEKLFKALAKGVGHTLTQKWEDLATDALSLAQSLSLETEPCEIAYELIERALVTSLFDLIADSATILTPDPDVSEDVILQSIKSQLVDEPIIIDEKFLDRPLDIPLVRRTQDVLEVWLEAHRSVGASGKVIAQRFPTYFVFALNNEWRKNEKRYLPLKAALDTPFTKASLWEQQWRTYASLLEKRVQEPSFDEAFSLKQIFIPPYAFFLEKPKKKQ